MPPFANQFALSLEITRLIPLVAITEAATKFVLNLARELRNSGSEIVVELDLAEIFGRSKVTYDIERAFRTTVGRSEGTTPINEEIYLQKGPGPTVSRALSQNSEAYLRCLVQCSFLTDVHDKDSLAAAISRALEKRVQDASPQDDVRAPPNKEGILGYLRAYEEQTQAFPWDHYLIAFASMLGHGIEFARESLPEIVLQGAIDMFPIVQNFPENYLIQIKASQGVCILLVWAHKILGLRVLVVGEGHRPALKLGEGNPQVVVNMDVSVSYFRESSITLLDSSVEPHEELITFETDSDESPIDGTWKIPALGYGKVILEFICGQRRLDNLTEENTMAIVEELASVAGANAQAIAKSLMRKLGLVKAEIEHKQILRATRFLFNRPDIDDIAVYYTGQPLRKGSTVPSAVSGVLQMTTNTEEKQRGVLWKKLLNATQLLTILILAFAHVRDLDECIDLPLCSSYELLHQHSLSRFPGMPESSADAPPLMTIDDDCWFHAIALLLVGHKLDIDRGTTCLLSDRG